MVFHSAVNTLLDVDAFGDEHMDYDDVDSNYSPFSSSSLAPQMPYTTPPSALNRSFSLPPQLQGRYGMPSSRYYSSSDRIRTYPGGSECESSYKTSNAAKNTRLCVFIHT